MSNLDSQLFTPGPLPANPHLQFRPGFSPSDGLGALESALPLDATPAQREALLQWSQCWQHILRWYHSPDLEAIRVCSAVALSHYATKERATWIFVLGPSGTGKTDLCIKSLTGLPKKRVLDQISSKSFSSGMGVGEHSLLSRAGAAELWLFKDFSMTLSENEDELKKIIGCLRSVWDGECSREVGAAARRVEWKGKITSIVAATPALENKWAVHADLGDRFLTIHWNPPPDIDQALQCMSLHIGHEEEIASGLVRKMASWINPAGKCHLPLEETPLTSRLDRRLRQLSILAARFRVRPRRVDGQISEVPTTEFPSRLIKGARAVRDYHARLFCKPSIDLADQKLAERILWDTFPRARRALLEALPPGETIRQADLRAATGLQKMPYQRLVEDLVAIDALERVKKDQDEGYLISWTPEVAEILRELASTSAGAGVGAGIKPGRKLALA